MILEALFDLAQQEGLMSDPDYEPKPVAWLVRVDEMGRIVGVESTHHTPDVLETKKAIRPVPKIFSVPREPGAARTSAARAMFLFDKCEYALGMDPTPEPQKRRQPEQLVARFALFRQRVKACADATGDEGVAAVSKALESLAAGETSVVIPGDCAPNELFGFVFAPDVDRLVHERPKVRAYWKLQRAQPVDAVAIRSRCIVTGELVSGAKSFPLLKRVPGGTTSGIALVSFNSPAFESHGWKGNENATISRDASEVCATALNRLLHPAYPDPRPGRRDRTLPRRHVRLSADTVVCYWSPESSPSGFLDHLATLMEGNDAEQVGELHRAVLSGRAVRIDDPARFCALTITGTQGRAVVRDWFESTVADVAENVRQHFLDLAIVRNTPPPKGKKLPAQLPLRSLLGALAPFGDREQIPAALATQFVHAALRGTPYPFAILQRALERARAEFMRSEWADLERRDARAALIKAVLRRNTPLGRITEAMDPTNTNPGYLLGRLMAVIERLQQAAMGDDVNASVVDRYFASASAAPRAVFVRLLKNARHHARKAKDEPKTSSTARWLESMLDEITFQFDPNRNGFPVYLDLVQQGLFVLGYHQQRHWLWMPKEERERWQTERTPAAAVTT